MEPDFDRDMSVEPIEQIESIDPNDKIKELGIKAKNRLIELISKKIWL